MNNQQGRTNIYANIPNTALYSSDLSVRELAYIIAQKPETDILNIEHTFASDEEGDNLGGAVQEINDSMNLFGLPSLAVLPRKKPKKYYIRKNPLPRILKRDFRRDFTTMYQNVVNSQEQTLIESFFTTFAVPSFHFILHNPMLACFGLNVIQQRQGLNIFIPECVRHLSAFADLVMTVEKAHIVQIQGHSGSKIIARLHGQTSRMMIPNPKSIMKLEHFFCTCAFFDRQKLSLMKSAIALRAHYIDSQQYMTISNVYSRLQESLQCIPNWVSGNTATWLESISSLLSSTNSQSSDINNIHTNSNTNNNIIDSQHSNNPCNTIPTTSNHPMNTFSQQPQHQQQQHTHTNSHNHNNNIPHNRPERAQPTHKTSSNHRNNRNRVVCDTAAAVAPPISPSNMFSLIDVEVLLQQMQLFYKSFQSTAATSTTSTETSSSPASVNHPQPSDSSDEHLTNRKRKLETRRSPSPSTSSSASTSSTSSPNRPTSFPHVLNFQDEPIFEICPECGKNKFPHAATLQSLVKPFLIRVSVHPIISFYFNDQNQLYQMEAVIPIDQYAYSMDLPASASS